MIHSFPKIEDLIKDKYAGLTFWSNNSSGYRGDRDVLHVSQVIMESPHITALPSEVEQPAVSSCACGIRMAVQFASLNVVDVRDRGLTVA